MVIAPQLRMLEALVDEVEQRLEFGSGDVGRDLASIGEQLGRLLRVHLRLAFLAAEDCRSGGGGISAAGIRRIVAAQRLRKRHFPKVTDAGWTLMLVLHAARLEGRALSLSRLREEAEVSPTTAWRWIDALHAQGLVTRGGAPDDERVVLIGLSEEAAGRIQAYLAAAHRLTRAVP